MRHSDGRPIAHPPALVREAEGRRGTADSVQIRPAVGRIDDGRRRTALRHGFIVEAPELLPGDFGLGHKEARDTDPFLRTFVGVAAGFVPGTAQQEFAARHGHHADGGVGARNGFRKGFETRNRSGGFIDFPGTGIHGALQFLMGITRDIVARIQVTAHTVEPKLFRVFLIMKVGGDAVVGDAFRIQVLVAFHAGFIIHDARGIVLRTLGGPIYLVLVLDGLGPHILGAHPELDHVIAVDARFLRRKVAGGAIRDRSAPIEVMGRLFPKPVGLFVVMAAGAGFVGGRTGIYRDQGHRQYDAQHENAQNDAPDDALMFHSAV